MVFDFFINNPTAAYFLVVLAIIFSYVIQFRLKSTFSRYSQVYSRNNVPANVIARQILDSYGLQHIVVRHIDGNLTDHFDPRSNEVALSAATFFSTSVAAIGVAAHEVGHAIQHN
ncbi:MAG: zinc metallopeptidase, partial [Ruminiclostridium sp.]|nr:zinc metallopeptidase [Ruminiclostridium sp.]